jgi:hypothetical protein
VGTPYATQTISAIPFSSGSATLSYSLTSSPLGLNFSASGDQLTISGTPTAAGTVTFTVTATDSDGSTEPQDYTLTINPLPGGGVTGTGTSGSSSSGGNVAPPSLIEAALTLYIDGIYFVIDVLEHNNQALAGVQASLASNMPYAGPFAEFFLLAGELAVVEQIGGGSNPALLASLGLGL